MAVARPRLMPVDERFAGPWLEPPTPEVEEAFALLQGRLRAFEPTVGTEERTVIAAHLENFAEDTLRRHAHDLPALEERWLYFLLALRWPRVHVVVVTSLPVQEEIVDYYLALIPQAEYPRARLTLLSVDDDSPRPLARKILERPEVLTRLRFALAGREEGAFIMPFNVGELERELALTLGAPIYGIDHRYAACGTKSGARRLFGELGVPHPVGEHDLYESSKIVAALARLRKRRPHIEAAVLKLNDGFYGEGNQILRLRDLAPPGTADERAELDVRLRSLPRSYLAEFAEAGGVAEEMIGGEIRSPSVQLRTLPGGKPLIISTHDQVLGGTGGQTFVGCHFPAEPVYAVAIMAEAGKVGDHLARAGAIGRLGVDFVVARGDDGWQPYAVEINLREGGTSHPWGTLWLLTQGSLDADGVYRTASGERKCYFATDALSNPAYRDVGLGEFLYASAANGVGYDTKTQTGAVYHMLSALETQGRIGVVAIGNSPEEADEIYLRVVNLLDGLSRSSTASPTH
jgi:hypothetical protein